jgi:hypothetical protein
VFIFVLTLLLAEKTGFTPEKINKTDKKRGKNQKRLECNKYE